MSQFAGYAKFYDDMYSQKPYEQEVDRLESFWKKYSKHPVKNILSLGCGTGTYEVILADRGYIITGVDLSPHMLEKAQIKIAKAKLSDKIILEQGDVRETKVRGQFDAVIMMFNIAGYFHTTADLSAVASNVALNLKSGGTFIYDCWYDKAVLLDPPTDRTRIIEKPGSKITRITKGSIDPQAKLVKISFDVKEETAGLTKESVTEEHPMRFWGLGETKAALAKGGLEILANTSFASPDEPVKSSEWDMFVIAGRK